MGLDNGIVYRGSCKAGWLARRVIPFERSLYNKDGSLDICYWRKCWNVRDAIISNLIVRVGECTTLQISDLYVVRRLIVEFLFHPRDWNNSIWTYKEIKFHLVRQIIALTILISWMKRDESGFVYFYDSY